MTGRKCRRSSATPAAALRYKTETGYRGPCYGLLNLGPRILEDALGARWIVYAAGAEARHVRHGLVRRAAAFFDPVDHFFRKTGRDHAVSTHGRKHQDLAVWQLLRLALKS